MKRVRLIVNADDFGNDENRTRAILECFRIGAITQTTALVNMPYFEEAARRIADNGLVKRMGIHLNLTEGPPLTERMRRCRFFCNEAGEFTCLFHLDYKKRFHIPSEVEPIVRDELRAQIETFLSHGGVYMHADSHHHVHTDWAIARIAFPLLKEYGFKTIRKSRNFGTGLTFAKRVYKSMFNYYATRSFASTDLFCSFVDLRNGVDSFPDDCQVEVMVQPMFGSPGCLSLDGPLTDSGLAISEELAFYENMKGLLFDD